MAESSGWVSPPKKADGSYDKEAVKELYISSSHMEWTAFARSLGWHPQVTRQAFPIKSWKKSKKRILAKQHAEEFEDLSFDQISLWKKETLRTIREYPKSIETLKGITDRAIQNLIREMNAAVSAGTNYTIPVERLERLANVMDKLTNAKHRSLLLNEISLKIAQEPLTPMEEQRQVDGPIGFQMKIIGKGNMSLKEIRESVSEWYDKPAPIDVTPQNETSNEVEESEAEDGD